LLLEVHYGRYGEPISDPFPVLKLWLVIKIEANRFIGGI
jgi:hypothetical protein